MATRDDIHRPSAIIPTDYEFVGLQYQRRDGVGEDYTIFAVLNERARIRLHMERTGGSFADHKGSSNCHVCGHYIIYKAVFYHPSTNTYLRTGMDCAEKLDMGDVNRFRMFREAVLAAQHHRAGKIKAKTVLAELKIGDAWEVYRNVTETPEMEKAFIAAMRAEPDEIVHRMAYADWLTENGQGHRVGVLLDGRPGIVVPEYPYEEKTIADIVGKLIQYGSLSPKQISFVGSLLRKIADRPNLEAKKEKVLAAREEEKAKAADVPTGRQTLVVEVLSVKYQEPRFRGQNGRLVMTVKSVVGGFAIWGTVPANCAEVEDRDENGGFRRPLRRGDRLELTADVSPSEKDPKFGFFRRPVGRMMVDGALPEEIPVEPVEATIENPDHLTAIDPDIPF